MSTLEFELTQADYDSLFRYQATKNPEALAYFRRSRLTWVATYVFFTAVLVFDGSPVWPIALLAAALFWLFGTPIMQWSAYRHARYVRCDPKGKHLGCTKLRLEDEALIYYAPDDEFRVRLDEIARIDETDQYSFIHLFEEVAIVPKPASGAAEFLEQLRRRV